MHAKAPASADDRIAAALLKIDATIGRLESRVAANRLVSVRQPSAVQEAAWREGELRDDAATTKAVAEAGRTLRDRLPAVADELQRLSETIRKGHASLKATASLDSLTIAFEALINTCGVLGQDSCCDLGQAVDLARGTAYVQRNGDVAYDRGTKVAS